MHHFRYCTIYMVGFVLLLYGCGSSPQKYAPTSEELKTQAVSLDEFITNAPGEELSSSIAHQSSAYRARRVEKTLGKMLDRQGYYWSFINRFKAWCLAHQGYYKSKEAEAECFESESQEKWLGAYSYSITVTASYGGEMTAGYATFLYYRNEEMSADRRRRQSLAEVARQREKARLEAEAREAQAKADEAMRQTNCLSALTESLRANIRPGTKTSLGMIIEIKPPLVQVQNSSPTSPLRWVEVTELFPPFSNNYCR